MDIFALQNQIEYHLDLWNVSRFDRDKYAGAINSVQLGIVNQKFIPDKDGVTFFEKDFKVQEQLSHLIKTVVTGGDNLVIDIYIPVGFDHYYLINRSTFPTDYGYPVKLYMLANGSERLFNITRLNQIDAQRKDIFSKPTTAGEQVHAYAELTSDGFKIMYDDYETLGSAKLVYCAKPTDVTYGTEQIGAATDISSLIGVYSTIRTMTACVFAGNLDGMNANQAADTEITLAGKGPTLTLTSGTIRYGYLGPGFPDIMFDEIALKVAQTLKSSLKQTAAQ